ncbi:MAG: glycoside hydrolase family 4 [Verrucomicrobiae bacterium]|nr:glycoside hydrolase family 4 [Verrucomicrobiae bacterium]
MKGPKVVLIGAGSAFFGRQTIWSMVSKEALCHGALALVDTDANKLRWMEQIARRAIAARGVPLKLEVSTDRKKVLRNADFVILAFANEGVKLRGIDAKISTRHGMTMCSADTIGPGGVMRTLREVPRQNAILRDVRRLCPGAWVINWANPTAAMGIAMMRHFPDLKTFAICDGPHNPHFENRLLIRAGLASKPEEITDALRSRVKIRAGGVNHFNWLIEMTCQGRDLTPRIMDALKAATQEEHIADRNAGKIKRTNRIAWQLASALGYAPLCIHHTQEYLPFFQGHDVDRKNAIAIRKWDEQERWKWMNECWNDMRQIASGRRPMEDFLAKTSADHASDIIEAMWAGLPKRFYLNVCNNGAVSNMNDDAFLELPCVVDMNRVRPLFFGDMPRPILGYLQRVLDEHELAVEAAVTCDRKTLRQAFLASMVAVSIPDAEACMNELLRAEREYLPQAWFEYAKTGRL